MNKYKLIKFLTCVFVCINCLWSVSSAIRRSNELNNKALVLDLFNKNTFMVLLAGMAIGVCLEIIVTTHASKRAEDNQSEKLKN